MKGACPACADPETTYFVSNTPGREGAVPVDSAADAEYLSRGGWFVYAETGA